MMSDAEEEHYDLPTAADCVRKVGPPIGLRAFLTEGVGLLQPVYCQSLNHKRGTPDRGLYRCKTCGRLFCATCEGGFSTDDTEAENDACDGCWAVLKGVT